MSVQIVPPLLGNARVCGPFLYARIAEESDGRRTRKLWRQMKRRLFFFSSDLRQAWAR
jgi:hypothetical protein